MIVRYTINHDREIVDLTEIKLSVGDVLARGKELSEEFRAPVLAYVEGCDAPVEFGGLSQ